MSVVLSHISAGSFLSRFMYRKMGEVLPRRLKRLMFMGSVLGVLTQNKKPNAALLYPLNAVLKAAPDASGFQFPIFMYKYLWKETLKEQLILSDVVYPVSELKIEQYDDMDIWRVAVFFAKRSRPFMQYGSLQMMATDIHDLITVIRNMPCAHGTFGTCVTCSDTSDTVAPEATVAPSCTMSFLDALKDKRNTSGLHL